MQRYAHLQQPQTDKTYHLIEIIYKCLSNPLFIDILVISDKCVTN